MARKPIYGCNKGLARTTVNGKRVYLGAYDSPESIAAFEQIIADWEAAHAERRPTVDVALTVSRLAVLFLQHADKEYRRDGVPTGETANFRHALQSMNNLFHGVRVIDFGPKNLINSGSNGQPIRFTGKVTFHPSAGYVGDDTFQYRVNDGVTNSDPAEVSLSVRNFAPRGAASFQRTTPGNAIIFTGTGLLASASDPDGDTLTLSIVTQPAHGTLTLVQTNGVYTGGYTYTPNSGYAGPDSFTWRVTDGATVSDTVTVSIDIQNNAPTIADRSFQQRYREATVNGSGQRYYTVDLATAGVAVDADKDALQYQIVTNGQHGTATLTPQGLLKWTSTSNTYVGNDKITVRVTDGYSFSDNAEITITVDNTKPIAAGDFYSIHHNATVSITPVKLLGNDFDFDGDTLHIVSMTNGAHGTLTQSGDNWTFNPQGWDD